MRPDSSLAGMMDLPAPRQLPRSASFTEAGLIKQAEQFEASLPSQRVFAAGSHLSFLPAAGSDASSLSFCIYTFDVESYNRESSLRFNWLTVPTTSETWVGLANFSTNRWDWFRAADPLRCDFNDIASHSGPSGSHLLYAVLLLRGGDGADLEWLRIGPDPGYNEVEDNDTVATANVLPAAPFSGFLGSIGGGIIPEYPGYDGDASDYLAMSDTLAAGQTLRFTTTYDNSLGELMLYLYDANASFLGVFREGLDGQASLTYQFNGAEAQPLVVEVFDNFSMSADYSLKAEIDVPLAVLTATPNVAYQFQPVSLDASASLDIAPGSITSYEFDPEGDGSFEPATANPTLSYSFTQQGFTYPRVRVTDDEGNTDIVAVEVQVLANPYDEREPNQEFNEADDFPAFPIAAFTGNIGPGGYAGDGYDTFRFNASAGNFVICTLTYPAGTSGLALYLYDSNENLLDASFVFGGLEQITYAIQPADQGPYFIRVNGFNDQFIDYSLDAQLN